MKRLSRTRLFLLEMLVNLLIFGIGASICFITLSEAYSISASSHVQMQAQGMLENAAMAFRSTNGNLSALPAILNGQQTSQTTMSVWYDQNWNVVSQNLGIYRLDITTVALENQVIQADICIFPPEGDAIQMLSVYEYTGI